MEKVKIMKILPFFSRILAVLLLCCGATQAFAISASASASNASAITMQSASVSQAGQSSSAPVDDSRDKRNLPQSASALPLLIVIGAGALLGGLFSARRTSRAVNRIK